MEHGDKLSQSFTFRPTSFGKSVEVNSEYRPHSALDFPSPVEAQGETTFRSLAAVTSRPSSSSDCEGSSIFGRKQDVQKATPGNPFSFGSAIPTPAFPPTGTQMATFPSLALPKKGFSWPSSVTTTTSVSSFPLMTSSVTNNLVFGINSQSKTDDLKHESGRAAKFSFVKAYQESREFGGTPVSSINTPAVSERYSLPVGSKILDVGTTQLDQSVSPDSQLQNVKAHPSPLKKPVISPAGRVTSGLRKSIEEKRSSVRLEKKLTSSEEIQKITSVVCTRIPEKLNKKEILHAHFSKFGKVKGTYCNTSKMHATVHFYDHAAAAAAKKNGTVIREGFPPVDIYWRQSITRKAPVDAGTKPPKEVCEELISLGELQEHNLLERPVKLKKQLRPLPEPRIELEAASTIPETKGENLSSIITSTATNLADKLRILDARDKLLRMRLQKQDNINTAIAKAGTCPDMCPEKERYSRIVKNTLSPFEISTTEAKNFDGEKFDHKGMIKEYSRSSADQEEPLPHELRPPQVLMQTMDHILCNVVDKMETAPSVAEWYDFIWNRTRAIRKDITQQHLCDLPSVILVEKCARFHIHCAVTLCEEDMATFDSKINNENLTKCLQTLKHLYHDLNLKGISCPNEAEFRSYDVLLNLNEGDTLRQVQQFDLNILQSDEVKFALEVFSALNGNNYIRFFRLARSASYLSSCILHRYFTQVRIKAMQSILKSYCRPNNVELFPVSDFIKFLALESEEEGQAFVEWLGLYLESSSVVLDRTAFAIPPAAPPIPFRHILVESKLTTSVGEMINGGPLPINPYPSYEPHDSFDAEGKLKSEAYSASDQTSKAATLSTRIVNSLLSSVQDFVKRKEHSESAISVDVAESKFQSDRATFSSEQHLPVHTEAARLLDSTTAITRETEEVADDITVEVLQLMTHEISYNVISLFTIHDTIFNDVCTSLIQEVCEETVQDEAEMLIKQKHAAKLRVEESREKAVGFITNEIMLEVIADEVALEIRKAQENMKQELLQALSSSIVQEMLVCVIDDEIGRIVLEVHQEAVVMLKEHLETLKEKVELARMKRAFARWQHLCAKRRKLEYARRTFPCVPLLTLGNRHSLPKKMKLSPEAAATVHRNHKKVLQLLEVGKIANLLARELAWSPIDLSHIIWNKIGESAKALNSWKMVLSLPSQITQQGKRGQEDLLLSIDLLCSKFRRGVNLDQLDSVVQTLSLYQMEMGHNIPAVTVCVKTIEGELDECTYSWLVKKKVMQGTSAIIFVTSQFSLMAQSDCHSDRRRLEQLLLSKPPQPPIPLLIVIIASNESHPLSTEVLHKLDVYRHREAGLISSCETTVLNVPFMYADIVQQMEHITTQLLSQAPFAPDLTTAYLRDYIEDGLTAFVFNAVYQDLAQKFQHQVYYQFPEAIVSLHNAAVTHLAKTATSPSLKKWSWPAPEFHGFPHVAEPASIVWNTVKNLDRLKAVIESFLLPPFPVWESESDSVAEIIDEVLHYVLAVTRGANQPTIALGSRVQHLLHSALRKSEKRGGLFCVPWAEIIHACLQFLLACSNFYEAGSGKEMKVHFVQKEYEDFHQPQEWKEAVRESAWMKDDMAEDAEPCECLATPQEEESSQNVCETSVHSEPCLPPQLSYEIENSLLVSRRESAAFLSKLEELVKEGELNSSPDILHARGGKERKTVADHSFSRSSKELPEETLQFLKTEIEAHVKASALHAQTLQALLNN